MADERQQRRYRRGTAACLVVALVAVAAAVWVNVAIGDRPRSSLTFGRLPSVLQWDLIMVTACAIGVLVARRRPANKIGWALSAGGALGTVAAAFDSWAAFAGEVEPRYAGGTEAWLVATALLYLSWGLLAVITPLLFPNGRLHSRRWRPVAMAGVLATAAATSVVLSPNAFNEADGAFKGQANPIGLPDTLGPAVDVMFAAGLLGLFGLMAVSIGALFVRLRAARGIERQQLRLVAWTAAATLVVGLGLALLMTPVDGTLAEPAVEMASWAVPLLLPVAIGVAVLRYRLYDVDVVVNRALVWTGMSAFVTIVYVVVVAGVGRALGTTDGPNLGLSIVATAVVAIGFQPARERIRQLAARIVYGQQATPYEVLAGLSRRVADAFRLDDALPEMAEAAATGVNAEAVVVRLSLRNGEHLEASWPVNGNAVAADHVVAVVHQGEEVGELAVAMRPGERLTGARRRLLDDLAAHAGVVLRNAQLAAELAARLTEVQASRQRILAAGDAARREVERDLHDGAQQRLVSLGLLLRLAAGRLVDGDGSRTAELLTEAAGELDVALDELRDLARGIHPAVLVDGGLIPALESLAEVAAVPVHIDVPARRYPPDIEVAAYFVVNEALANVAKYAGASVVHVLGRDRAGALELEVNDDGVGGADPTRGSGLRGLADRVATLQGTLAIESPPGGGTRLVARLPCA